MKKKNILILSSFLTFASISVTSLVSCNNGSKVEEVIKYKFEVINDETLGKVQIFNAKNELVEEALENEELFIKVDLLNNDYIVSHVLVNDNPLLFNEEKNVYSFIPSEDNFVIKVVYQNLYSSLNINADEGIKKYVITLKNDSNILKEDELSKLKIGSELSLKIDLLKNHVLKDIKFNGASLILNEETNTYDFKIQENNFLVIETKTVGSLTVQLSSFIKINKIILNDKEIEMPEFNHIKADANSTIEISASLLEGYVYLKADNYVFNNELGYALNEEQAQVKFDGQNVNVKILSLPKGDSTLMIQARKAEKFENEPFVGKLYSSNSAFNSETSNSILEIENNGKAKITYQGESSYAYKGEIKLENGKIKGVFEGKNIRYAKFEEIKNENNEAVAYIVSFSGDLNDVAIYSKTNAKDFKITTYKFENGKTSILNIKNEKLNLNSWFYYDGIINSTIKLTSQFNKEVEELIQDKKYYYYIENKKCEFTYNGTSIIGNGFEEGIYKLLPDKTVSLSLDGQSKYRIGLETGTYEFFYKKGLSKIVLTDINGNVKTYSLSLKDLTYEVYVPVLNNVSGLTFEFITKKQENIGIDEDSNVDKGTIKFIDYETMHITFMNQIDKDVEYKLTETGEFSSSFELVSGYREISGKFNSNYSKLIFDDCYLITIRDLTNVEAKVINISRTFKDQAEANKDLTFNEDLTLTYGDESGTYFVRYDENDVLITKGTYIFKLDLINNTYERLPDPTSNWFSSKTFKGIEKTEQGYEEFPFIKEAYIEFAGDGNIKKFDIKYYQYAFGGFEHHYSVENLKYTYTKDTREMVINAQGTKLKLEADEINSTLIFKHNFKLYNEDYIFEGFIVNLVTK